MRYLWLDLLIAFMIWQLSTYTYNHTTREYYLSQEVEKFNKDIESQNVLSNYHISKETNPNNISNLVEKMSDISRLSIKTTIDVLISFVEDIR